MTSFRFLVAWVFSVSLSSACAIASANEPSFTRQEDVIYGRKFGTALTMDVFRPTGTPNGAGLVLVVSGGWFSAHEAINGGFVDDFTKRGYTVFAVVHGSQPKFTIPECIADLNRSVRFIRHHAADYGVEPNRLGIYGGSAGGHLSLMQGTAGDPGDEKAKDPVDRQSSRVQAVACFFPPTDFLNYGESGKVVLGRGVLENFRAPFDFHEFDAAHNVFKPVEEEAKLLEIGRQISPVTHATSDDPPTLIIHGDADTLVPYQQAELIIDKLKAAGVAVELVRRPGAAHGWPKIEKDLALLADWFDKHLGAK